MNKIMALGAMATLATLAAACGDKDDDTGADVGLTDDERAAAVWSDISGYESWNQLDDFTGVLVSESVHGSYVQIWYDDAAFEHVQGGSGDVPDGATIVKEGYSDEGTTLTGITVMEKDSSFGSTGWFWANFSEDGTVNLAGDQSACSDCHSAGQDYNLTATW